MEETQVAAVTNTMTIAAAGITRVSMLIIVPVKGTSQDTIIITITAKASTGIITKAGKSIVSIGALPHERSGLPGWKHI